MGLDVLVDAERVHADGPIGAPDATGGLCLDRIPDGEPGDAELMSQGRDRDVETLQRVGRPPNGTGGKFRPCPGQRVLLRERGPRAVQVLAAPDPLGPQQPHRPAETRYVVQGDLAAAVADCDKAAVRATAESSAGLDTQNQIARGCRLFMVRGDWNPG